MRKQLEIILTALFPIMVLAIGYFVVSSKVQVQANQTTFYPAEAGPYYDDPGVDGTYFGVEINSDDLCDVQNGFNIASTTEAASIRRIRAANGNLGIRWSRTQDWRFGDVTPWGGDSAYIIYTDDMGWGEVYDPEKTGITGFPWEGSESHDRYVYEGKQYIFTFAVVTGYERLTHNNIKYVCPRYYKSVYNIIYSCSAKATHWADGTFREVRKHQFGPIELRIPGDSSSAARLVDEDGFREWFPCIELD